MKKWKAPDEKIPIQRRRMGTSGRDFASEKSGEQTVKLLLADLGVWRKRNLENFGIFLRFGSRKQRRSSGDVGDLMKMESLSGSFEREF